MKKIITAMLLLCIICSAAACSGKNDPQQSEATAMPTVTAKPTEESENEAEQPESETEPDRTEQNNAQQEGGSADSDEAESKPEKSDEKLPDFSKTAAIAETVLVDEDGVVITATGIKYGKYSAELGIRIENNSEKDLDFISGSNGYCCNSINGYMVTTGYLYCSVAAGKKANDTIKFSYDDLMLYGISEIADLEIGFDIHDDDYNHFYTGPRGMKSSAYSEHDYGSDYYSETIISTAAMNTFGYSVKYFSEEKLYDMNGITLLSSGIIENKSGEPILLLELENTTDNAVMLSVSDIKINGLCMHGSTWSSDTINPGKRGIIDIKLDSVMNPEYRKVYGIENTETAALSLTQKDMDGNTIAEKAEIEIIAADTVTKLNTEGIELYNSNGLRIIQKAAVAEPYTYSNDIHIFLLAENNSGRSLKIDDEYDSLSVNGYMTDYIMYNIEIKDGSYAMLDIEMMESSLQENDIDSVSDIEEVELKLKIREGNNKIDEPVITMLFD